MKDIIKIATRKSPLALAQAALVESIICKNIKTRLMPMTSSGDTMNAADFKNHGGKGLFLKELELSLLNREADIAVHSLKDVPAVLDDSFEVITIGGRENPSDVLLSRKYNNIKELPLDAKIGTSSPRRISMLRNISEDYNIVSIRGNIQTRLKKMDDEKMDGIILAAAGLTRMSLDKNITEYIPRDIFVPSAGQGVICIEYLKDNYLIKKLIEKYCLKDIERCAAEERQFVRTIGGDCMSPIGAHAYIKNKILHLQGYVGSINAKKYIKSKIEGGIESVGIGNKLANIFIKQGAHEILRERSK